jgi:hypothetical protein
VRERDKASARIVPGSSEHEAGEFTVRSADADKLAVCPFTAKECRP